MAFRDKLAPGGPRSDDNGAKSRSPSLDFVPLLCSAMALFSILFISISLGSHDWVEGTVVQHGQPVAAFVGLGSVTMNGHKTSLGRLCPKGTSAVMPKHYVDTPPAVWCKAQSAGTAGAWLMWLAFFPLWAACLLSAAEGLADSVAYAKAAKARLRGMGLNDRAQRVLLVGIWVLSWIFLFFALLLFAASTPDTLGWGIVAFESGFGVARLAFLLVTTGTALIAAKVLKLWHEESFVEALANVFEARGVRLALYALLFSQLVLFLLASVAHIEWQALVCLFGLYYLDTEKTNFLVIYVALVVATVLFDMIHILGLPKFALMESKEAFAESVYFVIFISKFACLGLFGYLKREEMRASTYPTTGEGDDPEIAE